MSVGLLYIATCEGKRSALLWPEPSCSVADGQRQLLSFKVYTVSNKNLYEKSVNEIWYQCINHRFSSGLAFLSQLPKEIRV